MCVSILSFKGVSLLLPLPRYAQVLPIMPGRSEGRARNDALMIIPEARVTPTSTFSDTTIMVTNDGPPVHPWPYRYGVPSYPTEYHSVSKLVAHQALAGAWHTRVIRSLLSIFRLPSSRPHTLPTGHLPFPGAPSQPRLRWQPSERLSELLVLTRVVLPNWFLPSPCAAIHHSIRSPYLNSDHPSCGLVPPTSLRIFSFFCFTTIYIQ